MNNLLDIWQGRLNRDEGINTAIEHADAVVPNWSSSAYAFLKKFASAHSGLFMAEDVRKAAEEEGLPMPPHNRAWGGVFQSAAKKGIIKRRGYGQVKNANAHCANATVWVKA